MCEKTHALRLQFEYEKNMWVAKHRNAALDEAFYHRNTSTNDQYSNNYDQSRQKKGQPVEESAIETSEEGNLRFPVTEHRDDRSNNFMYDVPDEYEYIPMPSTIEEPEDDEQDITRRKRKFDAPPRRPASSSWPRPTITAMDARLPRGT